jgi:hypothetical protein
MLRAIIFVCLILCFPLEKLQAQSKSDVFDKTIPVKFLGIDFSGAYLVAPKDTWQVDAVEAWMQSVNDLMLQEPAKFRVANAIGRTSVENHIEIANARNALLNTEELLVFDNQNLNLLKEKDIALIINEYDFKGLSGIGVMFNVESFNKFTGFGNVWVTFINLNTRQVLFTELMQGRARGFGLRNYWAYTIFEIIKKMENGQFKVWEQKYR